MSKSTAEYWLITQSFMGIVPIGTWYARPSIWNSDLRVSNYGQIIWLLMKERAALQVPGIWKALPKTG